ncbi:hypothetical protein [Brucella pituitosa]|uniref:hypothetical protein n=1 Tax=Brucella pituitosa TaxID=571256 RepID=UPI001FFCB803|nr:hypothetical protein [Brucella pituitosa]
MISANLVGCATARNKGTCDNRRNIRRDKLEARVLNALRHHLMEPELFKELCDEFTREMNRLRMEARSTLDAAQAELKRIDRELERILDLYLQEVLTIEMVKERGGKLEARKKDLERLLREAEEPPPLLHPNMAHHYRVQVDELYAALQEDSEQSPLRWFRLGFYQFATGRQNSLLSRYWDMDLLAWWLCWMTLPFSLLHHLSETSKARLLMHRAF